MKLVQPRRKDKMNNITVLCNKCGKKLKTSGDIVHEDFIEINKAWGWFSKKDGQTHKCIICEECCEELEKTFVIPVKKEETVELV